MVWHRRVERRGSGRERGPVGHGNGGMGSLGEGVGGGDRGRQSGFCHVFAVEG